MFSVIHVDITLHVLTHFTGQLTPKEDGDATNKRKYTCVHYKAIQTCFNLSRPIVNLLLNILSMLCLKFIFFRIFILVMYDNEKD